MKHLLCIFLMLVVTNVAADEVVRLSEPVESDAQSETFGEPLDLSLPRMSLDQLITDADANLGKDVLVDTRIAKVCQKKGCFFMAQDGEVTLRVSFKDYGFFVPTDTSGKHVTLAGQLVTREMTTEQAEHFRADMDDATIDLEAGTVYEIVANAVRIPR